MSNYSFLSYNAMSWGYWTEGARDSEVIPFVSMYKAVTRGRHLTHLTERLDRFPPFSSVSELRF